MRRLIVALAVATCVAACGQSTVVTPYEVAQNYVYAIAEGNLPGACGMIEAHARAALLASTGQHISCPSLFRRCLPNSIVGTGDQSQLLYGTFLVDTSGDRARATMDGTPAANATRRVSMIDKRTRWLLTSPGLVISRCVGRLRRHRHHSRHHHHG